MCIRDRIELQRTTPKRATDVASETARIIDGASKRAQEIRACLLYTSDAADERSSVDLGGRRIIKKKNNAGTRGRSGRKNETYQERDGQ